MTVGVTLPAFADGGHSGPPDGSGFYGYCNVKMTTRSGNQTNQTWMSCNYGPAAEVVDRMTISGNINGSGFSGLPGDLSYGDIPVNSAGLVQWHYDVGDSPTGGTVTLNGTGTISFVGDASNYTISLNYVSGTGYPTFPGHYWSGGSSGNVSEDVAGISGACSRTLEADPTTAGRFRTGVTEDPNATDTYEWDFGDGGTSTAKNPTHVYDLSEQPEGGWTATVTVTRDPDSGHAFSGGSEDPAEEECSLRVDFFNPGESDPESTEDGEGQDDSDCPSGWGWLNPAAIGSILRCLFIPSDFGSEWDTLTSVITTTYPFGPLIFGFTAIGDVMGGFNEGVAIAAGTEDSDVDCDAIGSVDVPGLPGEDPVRAPVFPVCDPGSGAVHQLMIFTRLFSGVAFAVVGILLCLRLGAWMLGASSPVGGGGGDDDS